ncbi:senescence-specific cysteine protease SAG39-like [Cucumis melo var. makuwa]|uniref:Senescence-specific cysteine protease SAG39-like n=1 Tax=Cucumis melo var. makuwa TaxID=1194695 RepID=A0A5A7TAC2_CUCMM|nr:senescence-specific cysteine protease SAG39-like [Cucumis melo var. makuwa]
MDFTKCKEVKMMKYLTKFSKHVSWPPTSVKGQYVRSVTSIQQIRDKDPGIDWRTRGAVTPVQYQLGDTCVVYAAVAAVEGIYQIETRKLVKFSEDDVIRHCLSHKNGGYTASCISQYGIEYGFLPKGQLRSKNKCPPISSEWSFIDQLRRQPLMVSIKTGHKDIENYSGGIYHGPFGPKTDHEVVVVGYTPDYYILKNSWGDWGEDGYMKLSRDAKVVKSSSSGAEIARQRSSDSNFDQPGEGDDEHSQRHLSLP